MSTEENVKCPDCVALPENPISIILSVPLILLSFSFAGGCLAILFSKNIRGDGEITPILILFFSILSAFMIGTFLSILYQIYLSIIGKYTYSYLDPEDQSRVHTHKTIVQNGDQFFHIKKTKTADSYIEQRVEIISPIFRLKCGGWFKKPEILNVRDRARGRCKIISSDNTCVLLGNDAFFNVIQLRASLQDSLRIVSDYCNLYELICKADTHREALAETKRERDERDKAMGERDFLGYCMQELVREIIASKSKTKSPVGQAIREKMGKILMLFAIHREAVFEAWSQDKSDLAAANPTFADFMKRLESMTSSEQTGQAPEVPPQTAATA